MSSDSDVTNHGWLSPLVHLSNNWLSLLGIVLVTTASIFWLFLLPETLKRHSPPYIGILAFLIVPACFFLGLALIPLGIRLEGIIGAGVIPTQQEPRFSQGRTGNSSAKLSSCPSGSET
jgi:hypothetical protein